MDRRDIVVTRHWNDFMGNYQETHEIRGTKGALWVTLPKGVEGKIGTVFTLYPLRFRIVAEPQDFLGRFWMVEPDGWRAALIQYTHGFWVWLAKTYRRIIWTLAIWDLAVLPEGEIASWRCIKLFRRGNKK